MTDDNSILDRLDDESRRSFMKKGAVATGGLALGVTGAAAQEETPQETPEETPQGGEQGDLTALVFADDYRASIPFQPVGTLGSDLTQNVLQGGGDGDGGVENPQDYQGYVIRYNLGETNDVAMLFVSGGGAGATETPAGTATEGETTTAGGQGQMLEEGQTYTLGGEASVVDPTQNLLEVSVSQGEEGGGLLGGILGGDGGDETETPAGATETPAADTETPAADTETPGGVTETPGGAETTEEGGDLLGGGNETES